MNAAKGLTVTSNPVSSGTRRTLDMSVDSTHSYQIAIPDGNIVSHNTLSLLGGCTPGCHPGIFKHFIRRIRMSSDTPLVDICRKHGYEVEHQMNFDGTVDHTTDIPCFPCKYPDGTILAKDMSAIKQMEIIKKLQSTWSDNAVSCTVYYKPEELKEVREWLDENYTDNIKSISFMLHQDHGFSQAPYEEITLKKYEELTAVATPVSAASIKYYKSDDALASESACSGGMCPVK